MNIGTAKSPIVYSKKQLPVRSPSEMIDTRIKQSQVFDSNEQLTKIWGLYTFGTGIGYTGFYAADFNQDGSNSIVFSSGAGFGSNTAISVLEKKDNYEIVDQFTLPDASSVNSLVGFFDDTSDNHLLFVAGSNGKVYTYNLTSKRWLDDSLSFSANKLIIADVNSSKGEELIAIGSYSTSVFSLSGTTALSTYEFGDNNAVVGHFMSSNSVDIALGSGKVYTLKDTEAELIWDYSTTGSFGSYLGKVDSDSDGIEELIGAKSWYSLESFDVSEQAMLWSHRSDLDIDAMYLFDVNNDGIDEILYGDGQWGSVHALSAKTGERLWKVNNPNHGVTQIFVADIDNDAEHELIWGNGYSSTGSDHLMIHDLNSLEQEWISSDISGPFHGHTYADVDNDGETEIVAVSFESNSGYDDGVIYIFDAKTKALEWQSAENLFNGNAWTGVHDLTVADVDNDGKNEIIVGTDRLYDGVVYVIDGEKGSVEYSKVLDSGSPIYSVTTADIDNDGEVEIIAAGGKEHTGSPGKYIYILNGKDGELEKKSPILSTGWDDIKHIEVFDQTKDGLLDVVAVSNGVIKVYDVANDKITSSFTSSVVDISFGIFDENIQLIALHQDGAIYSYDEDLKENQFLSVCNSNPITLSRISYGKLGYTCQNDFGFVDLSTTEVTAKYSGIGQFWKVSALETANGYEYLVGGSSLAVFQEASDKLELTALNAFEQTHAKQILNGQLTVEQSVENLQFIIIDAPEYGEVEFIDRVTGEYKYIPNGNIVGEDSFSFIALAGASESNIATITIDLTNNSPEVVDQTISLHWQGTHQVQLNASDADNDQLFYRIVKDVNKGMLTPVNINTGLFEYTNEGNDISPVSFSFTVSDTLATSDVVTMIISFSNAAPIANDLTVETYYATKLHSQVSATDENSDTLTFELISQPATGELTLDIESGLFEYQPHGQDSYTTTFTYRAFDGVDYSETQTVIIKVVGEPAPIIQKEKSSGGSGRYFLLPLLFILLMRTKRKSVH
ncbi:FG-GAP-like repeat-containing protein [Pseudoalteromonas piratica]|uniref:Cadherin domain-containing protein n=1 Tax=Pseudoalteromonas piratica TaxID=1348114 RepID=A0A0A7ELC3_9GAMM|nr:FG-GAP-like repeat-containing protein [Pseudoalteromonas piratica]AIY67475.1 hypothetical protein OM33_20855 [Pseudoalteromonas piratica]